MRFIVALLLGSLLAFGAGSNGTAQTQPVAAGSPIKGGGDFRAAFRSQIEDELALLRPRLKVTEDEARQQAEKYKEMAASKAEMAHKTQEKTQAARAKADAAAAKKGYIPKPPAKGAGASASGAAKKGGATDAKADGGDKAKGGEAGGATAAPKKVDPVLTQQYVVMGLRDQVRQLRERIVYLEGLLAKL